MKRKSFLSSSGAKSALAAIVITAVAALAGCKKEEYHTEILEPAPARAVIMSTVYDHSSGQFLASGSETVEAGEDGTIAAQTRTVKCPAIPYADRYLQVNDITVPVPALAKGQFALIPIHFYALKITDAVQEATIIEDPATVVTQPHENTSQTYGPYPTDTEIDIEYEALSGQKILNMDEVNRYIDNLPETRAIDPAEVKKILKATVATYNPGIKEVTVTDKIEIAKNIIVEFQPTTTMIKSIISISATVDGVNYNIPNIKIEKAGATVIKQIIVGAPYSTNGTITDWTSVKR